MPKGVNPETGKAWNSKEIDPELVRQMIEQEGLTHAAVGIRVGLSTGYVSTFCQRHQIRSAKRGPRRGEGHPNWDGGRFVDVDGYVNLWNPEHPCRRKNNYVLEHRAVACEMLGRTLMPGEVVHHRNGIKTDNRPENLEVFATNAEHLRHELTGRVPNWTEDGQARIRAAIRKSNATRRKSKPDAPSSP